MQNRLTYLVRSLAVLLLVASWLLVPARPAVGNRPVGMEQEPGAAPAPEQVFNPFLTIFPELKGMDAPRWLKESFRATYYVQSASVAQVAGEEGGGGAGYLQFDVVGMDTENVAVSTRFFLDGGGGMITPSFTGAAITLPGAGEFWLHPAVLEDAERVANEDLAVVRMPKNVAGYTYDAVRFEYHSDEGVYVWMFDEVSGLLLFYRHEVGGPAAVRRQLADMTLAGTRRVKLPWSGRTPPPWLERGIAENFDGTYSVVVPTVGPTSFPTSVSIKTTAVHGRWTSNEVATYFAGRFDSRVDRVTGVGQIFDALWLPRQALTARVRASLIDRDPVTGVELHYTRGGGTVQLTERGDAYVTTLTYDARNGQLLAVEQQTQVGIATQILALERVE
ncbi:MAG: hypothetical protein H3C34_21035 [Caldilineaceae bacterium]|nr:hypothetical protein [Caldilineaceae bacterium]